MITKYNDVPLTGTNGEPVTRESIEEWAKSKGYQLSVKGKTTDGNSWIIEATAPTLEEVQAIFFQIKLIS